MHFQHFYWNNCRNRLRKKAAMNSGGKKETRKPVVKPPVISSRNTKAVDNISSQAVVGPGESKVLGIKKNLLPTSKMNPAAVRIKGTGSIANTSSERRQPMVAVADAVPKSSGRRQVPTSEEIDEEVLMDLHSEYLRTRLMAQIALKKSRLSKEKSVTSISELAVKQTLDKDKVGAQIHTLRRIQTEAEHLVKVRNLNGAIDPLVGKLFTDDMHSMNQELSENLSATLDLLPVRNASASLDDINANNLAEINKNVLSSQENPESSLGCLHGLKQDEVEFKRLVDESETEDKEVNDKLMNMMSMKLSLIKCLKK
ncbi:unnamed protein product [Allacma fusca]|uniref:Uncharacterized protein n=1 Tax=Allacma fusca TaxID=39272 RepID=A0A8J2NSE3_9HEXA|nr:unnamed protein product [Allacma fusca]